MKLKMADKSISHLFKNQKAFANAKRSDTDKTGRNIILKFLGGNWKAWMIQETLIFIDDYKEYLDKELASCETLEELKLTDKSISKLFKNQQAFAAAKRNDKYEIACGHHRLSALKELGIKETEITVEDYTNERMIQIMGEENLDWSTSPPVIIQTVQIAKEYLDGELAKYETYEEFCAGKNTSTNFGKIKGHAFSNLKNKGVGRAFLKVPSAHSYRLSG